MTAFGDQVRDVINDWLDLVAETGELPFQKFGEGCVALLHIAAEADREKTGETLDRLAVHSDERTAPEELLDEDLPPNVFPLSPACRSLLPARGARTQNPDQKLLREILKAVAIRSGTTVSQLVGRGQSREIARPRMLAMYLARRLTRLSLPAIGDALRRDHSTILYGVRQIEASLDDDQGLRDLRNIVERDVQLFRTETPMTEEHTL